MNHKKLIATICVFVGVLLVAGVLYSRMSAQIQPNQDLVTATTEAAAEVTTEATMEAATEATQPKTFPAVDFTVVDSEGNEVKLSDYFGKPIVLNFWTYWCNVCKSEMFHFNEKHEQLGGEVVFLMVHADPDTAQGKALIAENNYTFPVVYDELYQASHTYGISAFPTTFFIDAEGNLQAYYIGAMGAERLQMGVDMIYTP